MDISELSVLLTGGAGFIGHHIAEYLLKNGAKAVYVLDDLSNGKYENIQHLESFPNFHFTKGSITDYELCLQLVQNVNTICHQAARASVPRSILEPDEYHSINVTGFTNLLNAARHNGIKRIVYASSSAVYGTDAHYIKSEHNIGKALSPYALTKYMDELYSDIYTRLYGMECIGLRYFNVFGPKQALLGAYSAVIPKFLEKLTTGETPVIYGDGSQTRDFTYVENVVLANIMAMTTKNSACFGEAFNIGTGSCVSVLELFDMIVDILKVDIKPTFADKRIGDVPHTLADTTKARDLLGWTPKVSREEGLQRTVNAFLQITGGTHSKI